MKQEIVPLGTKLKWGTVEGVQSMGGERYYFIVCNKTGTTYLPADVVEAEYERTKA